MRRGCYLTLLTLLLPLRPALGVEDDATHLQQALALQKVMQKVIRDVEPSIACILVSRSEAYRRAGPPSAESSGQLGGFDANAIDYPAGLSDKEREAFRKKLDLADSTHVPESFGSGVVIDARGLILTHYHVVQGATKVFVRLPGERSSYADIHAADPRSDLAVLKLIRNDFHLRVMPRGDGGKLERGQFILSIANPFAAGFRDGQPSASWGIISNLRRRAPGIRREEEQPKSLHHYGTLIQTDARLHLGCSGGALVNLQGEMVGLTTALAAIHGGETPGGFAIPCDSAMWRIIDVLKKGEEVDYGFLGVGFNERRSQRGDGVALENVIAGSPAANQAKLHPRDVILAVNGTPVKETDDLFLFLGTELAGTKIKLEVRRLGRTKETVEVTLAKLYVAGKRIVSSLGDRPYVRGLRVDHASLLAQEPYRHLRIPAGVLIAEVQADSAAAKAQLKPGEVISHVNGRPVYTPAAFYAEVLRQNGRLELTLPGFNQFDPPTKITVN